MQRVFHALAEENRRQILKLLKKGPLSAGEVAKRMPIGKAALSHHFAILSAAELVDCERRGQQRIYSLDAGALEVVARWALELARTGKGRRRMPRPPDP